MNKDEFKKQADRVQRYHDLDKIIVGLREARRMLKDHVMFASERPNMADIKQIRLRAFQVEEDVVIKIPEGHLQGWALADFLILHLDQRISSVQHEMEAL